MQGLKLTQQTLSPEQLGDLCDVVYRIRLEQDCRTNVERMLAKDREKDPTDTGGVLRRRADAYGPIVKAVLQALEIIEPGPQLKYLIDNGQAGPFTK